VKTTGIATDSYVDMHAYTLKEPYGVVGLIFPWNGPVFNAAAKLAPALAAGCSSIVKRVVEASAGNLKKVMLELGGKSPVLIYDDAELDKVAPRKRAA
jgi:acyl-CoA reductase-like NAD-dependent aldehyde dehydrogenase